MTERVEFWPSRIFLGVSIFVWTVLAGLTFWAVTNIGWLGDVGRWAAASLLAGALAGLGAVHVWGSQLAGPTLVADRAGLIFRDGRVVWGPIPWSQIRRLELDEARRAVGVWVEGVVQVRSVIGLRWVVEDRNEAPEVLWIASHVLDNRGADAYAALTRLREAER